MKKLITLLMVAAFLLLVLSGCLQISPTPSSATTTAAMTDATTAAPTTTATAATGETTAATGETTAAAFPVTVQDANGQDVVIASAPQSIVSTNLWSAEILLDMVDSSRIAGLSAWGDDPVLSATADKAKAVAARISTQEPENIAALSPDLVIIDTFSDPDGSLTKTLTEAGAVVLQMNSPTTFEQIESAIATIAAATGEVEAGQAMIDAMEAKLDAVAGKLSGLADEDKLTVMYYDDFYDQSGANAGMLCAYGGTSPFAALAAAAGLVNVCDAVDYSAVSKEKVVGEWKPDVLIVSPVVYNEDFSVTDNKGETVIAGIKADALLQTLPAVQNNRIYALTAKYNSSTSQYMADAVVELASAAYPELFQ